MLLQRRTINLSSMMSVIFDLAMRTMRQELEGDKVEEDPLVTSNRSIPVSVLRKTERQ